MYTEYFANLGVQLSESSSESFLLVDDNARISHPIKDTSGHRRLKKTCRWDSDGCLRRLEREDSPLGAMDTSPSVLRRRKSSTCNEVISPAMMAPKLSRRASFDGRLAMSPSSGSLDKPLKHPLRGTTPKASRRKLLSRHHSCTKLNSNSRTPMDLGPLPSLFSHLPYDLPSQSLSSSSSLNDNNRSDCPMDNFDLVKALDDFGCWDDSDPTTSSLAQLECSPKTVDRPLLVPKRTSPTSPRVSLSMLARSA